MIVNTLRGEEKIRETRVCSTCLCEKPLDEFEKAMGVGYPTYRRSKCKTCRKKQTLRANELKKQHPYPDNSYSCPICNITQTEMKNKGYAKQRLTWCLDHNHDTGEFRGYICQLCNTGISNLQEDITVLNSAISYLKKDIEV